MPDAQITKGHAGTPGRVTPVSPFRGHLCFCSALPSPHPRPFLQPPEPSLTLLSAYLQVPRSRLGTLRSQPVEGELPRDGRVCMQGASHVGRWPCSLAPSAAVGPACATLTSGEPSM